MRSSIAWIILLIPLLSLAQRRNAHWLLGDGVHLEFIPGVPPILHVPTGLVTSEGQSVISDLQGDLLFIAGHDSVYNALGHCMPNGQGPFTMEPFGDVTQGSLIIPLPGSPERYVVVHIHGTTFEDWPKATCSVVDMSLDGGLGDVVPGSRWTFTDSLTEKLTGTPHSNGSDYWVLLHEWDTDEFQAFLVDGTGLDTVPVTSHAGSPHDRIFILPDQNNNFQGQMKFSMSGERIALSTSNGGAQPAPSIVQLFDFDDMTGQVGYRMTFPGHSRSYGIEFSGDGSKLYVSGIDSVEHYLDQYDLGLDDTTAIQNSRDRVYSYQYLGDPNIDWPGAMVLAPDGRIYLTHHFSSTHWMGVIDHPDSNGVACGLLWNALDISPGVLIHSFCNQIKHYHDSPFAASVRPITPRPGLNLWPNPIDAYAWLDGVAERGALQVRWRDAAGRVVRDEQVYSNGFGVLLAVGQLSDGAYAVELLHNGDRLGVVRAVVRR
ncbi:MAG: hypothetical protein IPK99_05985 [Flavobacteriales bacterium]|nr:hypothetical protein [Flavobacteriales bacterium]